jgi:hypothetical protein
VHPENATFAPRAANVCGLFDITIAHSQAECVVLQMLFFMPNSIISNIGSPRREGDIFGGALKTSVDLLLAEKTAKRMKDVKDGR